MKVKNCIICGQEKPLDSYYKHPQMGDGHLNKCKDCTKEHSKQRFHVLKNNAEWVENEKARARDKYHRLGYKDKHKPNPESKKVAILKYKQKYPEKQKARNAMNKMSMTKIKGTHLHHWSYNQEHYTDVIQLTVEQHNLAHRFMIYDQERMKYRRIDTMELLDTKEQHEQYIKNLPF